MITVTQPKPNATLLEWADRGLRCLHRNKWLSLGSLAASIATVALKIIPSNCTGSVRSIAILTTAIIVPIALLSLTRKRALDSAVKNGDRDTVQDILETGLTLSKNQIENYLFLTFLNDRCAIIKEIAKHTPQDVLYTIYREFLKNPISEEFAHSMEELYLVSETGAAEAYLKKNPPHLLEVSRIIELMGSPKFVRHRFHEVTTDYLNENPKNHDEVLKIARQIASENSNSNALALIARALFHKSPDKAHEVAELMGPQLIDKRTRIMSELIAIHDPLELPPTDSKTLTNPTTQATCRINYRDNKSNFPMKSKSIFDIISSQPN